ncbi:flagellar biosynthesis protein FlhF [Frateuria aurantia]|uniref:Flagellar biosynthesis protein FlhF n=1 Tax=Frateuria aurantia (strain ATCC 33424 / DSM 6220 / KCTC 2777 / LMG 1558 / NBRC 3245 / NCIMB 13370) TaxID=767434 RepID=H8L3F5_FRAAD|nr:flagellar biosynthesis protein FlhF [Frateuria aurantia]AFC86477.1 flagellar biosynthetic protein FlhF [Frateuria aurantia DSM 6220]
MKIKRFIAADMRMAMRAVREEQGPDAVILSTRNLDDGIEVIAATDYDEALVKEAAGRLFPAPAPASRKPARPSDDSPFTLDDTEAQGNEFIAVQRELSDLRKILEGQIASLAWNELGRRKPQHVQALRELSQHGIEPDIAMALVDELPPDMSAEQARYLPLGLISNRLLLSGRRLTDIGGVLALVGNTGVGKTTTIAKLAAHFVLQHGADGVALIGTDNYRIGAGAQLGHYGKLLGVRVHHVHDAGQLQALLQDMSGYAAVLIDTAGMSSTDPRLRDQMAILEPSRHLLRTCLVLAANTQASAQEEAIHAYQPLHPASCILTKLDESPSIGSTLSVLLRHRLPLDYITQGQRVPEDIIVPQAHHLIHHTIRRGKVAAPSELDDLKLADRYRLHSHPAG